MDSPISPLIANLFMEFKIKAICSASTYSSDLWMMPLSSQQAEQCHQFLQLINSHDPHIQFTTEDPKEDGSIPFLDTLVYWGPNNTLTTTVYHKPAHTDQNLHWDSNHFLTAKHRINNTLTHRASIVCTSQTAFQQKSHITQALLKCNFAPGPWTTYIPSFTMGYICTTHTVDNTTQQ